MHSSWWHGTALTSSGAALRIGGMPRRAMQALELTTSIAASSRDPIAVRMASDSLKWLLRTSPDEVTRLSFFSMSRVSSHRY